MNCPVMVSSVPLCYIMAVGLLLFGELVVQFVVCVLFNVILSEQVTLLQ